MLEMSFGEPAVAGAAQAAAPDGLGVGALDAGSRGICLLELGRPLARPHRLKRLVVFAILKSDDARLDP